MDTLGPGKVSCIEGCPHFRDPSYMYVDTLGPGEVSCIERCPDPSNVDILGPGEVSCIERCPHFRDPSYMYVDTLGPGEVSCIERCPHFRDKLTKDTAKCTYNAEMSSFLGRHFNVILGALRGPW